MNGTLIIDFSQVVIGGLQSATSSCKIKVLDKDLCRHLILNSLRVIILKFKKDYNEIIIACDSRKYWRKDIFPHYKANRKNNRDKSDFDWVLVFEVFDELKPDLKELFPYKVIEIDKAEADDIIGTLVPRLSTYKPVLIVSSDGDFKQLHKYKNVKQYNPQLKVFIKSQDPLLELKEKILVGDKNDGIPNVLSGSESFVMGIRQKSMTKPLLERYIALNFDDSSIENYDNIQRNKSLIDLSMIPQEIKDNIVEEYEKEQTGSKQLVKKYFIKHRLGNLLECLDEF